MVLVVTGNSFMLLDPKSLSLKYRVELQHVKQISLSSFSDHIFVLHLDPVRMLEHEHGRPTLGPAGTCSHPLRLLDSVGTY